MSLDQKIREADRIYEEFEPPTDWDHDEASDTAILMLPRFKKEQLRVQVTSTRVLRVSGERQISENKWGKFRKEFAMPSDSDTNGISAKFEAGILYIRLPKVIIKQQPATPKPTTQEAPKPQPQPQPQQPITTPDPQKPNINAQVSDQKKPIMEEKAAAESKPEGQKPAVKERMAEKGKELKDYVNKKVGKEERVEGDNAMASKVEEKHGTGEGKMEKKKSLTMDTVSFQRREYMNALCGLVDEVKKKKKLVNLLVLIFFVLLLGIYVKNAIKSYF